MRVTDALRDRAEVDPDDLVAADLGTGRLFAGEADRTAATLAAELDTLPGPGLVILRLTNSLAAVPALAGVLRSRHALVLVHPEAPARTIEEALSHLGPAAEVTVDGGTPLVHSQPYGPARPTWIAPDAAPALRLALCVLTSGTTGRPRLIAAPHRQVLAATDRIQARLAYCRGDIVPVVSPISFDYGLYQVFLAWRTGATAILDPQLGTVANVLVAVARAGATVLPLVPTMLRAVAASPLVGRVDTSRVRLITTTGDLLTEGDAQATAAAFPNAVILPMYGLSECKRVAITPRDEIRPPGAVGRALDGVDAVVLSADGRPVPAGTTGELTIAGPLLTLGYLTNETATAQRFKVDPRTGARLLRTGDQLRLDGDGWLYWVGRSHDVIKTSGYRVDPAEIETAAAVTGLIAECGAYGLPDSARGQVPVLRLRLRDGVDPHALDHIADALRTALPSWAIPQLQVTSEELPHTRNGKIDRQVLAATVATAADLPDSPANGALNSTSDKADAVLNNAPASDESHSSPPTAIAMLSRPTNLISCHTQAVLSAYAWAGDPSLFDLATTVPFGVRTQPDDPNRVLIPWLDPDIGLDRAAAVLGLRAEVHWHDDADAAFARLHRWLRTGAVVLGPLDLGGLPYHALADTLHGCDHYVAAVGTSADQSLVLIDPEGYVQVQIAPEALRRAWAATAIPEGRGAYMLRRFTPATRFESTGVVVSRIAAGAAANLRDAGQAPDGGAAGYRTLADAELGPSGRRGLYLLLPSAASRARLAGEFAALVATMWPGAEPWRHLAELWNRQVATLASAHRALRDDGPVAAWLRTAADTEQELAYAAVAAVAAGPTIGVGRPAASSAGTLSFEASEREV